MSNPTARILLKNNIIGLVKGKPVRFKSGILSPVYTDNRKLSSYPKAWRQIIVALFQMIKEKKINFDVIAGIESAAIPHSAALSFFMKKPSVFVRKEVKVHGLQKRVEGMNISGKKALLIEDTISTGGSSISGIMALREEGAIVTDCISIVNYNFPEVMPNFKKAGVKIYSLVSFIDVISEAVDLKYFSKKEGTEISIWLKNPHVWSNAHEEK